MKVGSVVGVVHTAGLDHEIITVVIVGEELDSGFRHLHDGGLIAIVVFETIMVVAEVARGEQAEHLTIAAEDAPGVTVRGSIKRGVYMDSGPVDSDFGMRPVSN